jgi:hypothetical protein
LDLQKCRQTSGRTGFQTEIQIDNRWIGCQQEKQTDKKTKLLSKRNANRQEMDRPSTRNTDRLSKRNANRYEAERLVGGNVSKQKCKQTDVGKVINEK